MVYGPSLYAVPARDHFAAINLALNTKSELLLRVLPIHRFHNAVHLHYRYNEGMNQDQNCIVIMPTLSQQDDALEQLIRRCQWKEAFKLCEKKLKKAKGSDYLLVILYYNQDNVVNSSTNIILQVQKIAILLAWPEHEEQGYKELDALFARKPPVSDIETLLFLDDISSAGGLYNIPPGVDSKFGKQFSEIWLRAATSRPKDENLHALWYRTKFEKGDFQAAKKVRVIYS